MHEETLLASKICDVLDLIYEIPKKVPVFMRPYLQQLGICLLRAQLLCFRLFSVIVGSFASKDNKYANVHPLVILRCLKEQMLQRFWDTDSVPGSSYVPGCSYCVLCHWRIEE